MEKEFVPYGLELKLRAMGCEEMFECVTHDPYPTNHPGILWQQAFDWFRKEKDLLNHLTTHLNAWGEDGALETYYGYRIMIDKDGWKCEVWEKLSEYETYAEARQACLEKLIKLIENKNEAV